MKIFEATVVRINDVPAQNGSFSQKEIIVIPYSSDAEVATEYVAVPPSIFPTDVYGSGSISLPDINQRCIVAEMAGGSGDKKVNILSYAAGRATSAFGEYTPINVSQGGVAFKIGGVKPTIMYFHKGGKWEVFSNDTCNLYLDGTKKKIFWSILEEERLFAGGRVNNTYEELEGIEEVTRHVEIYTKTREWMQNTDIRIAGEKSVMNPETSIVPTPTYAYVPKVIIKAGTIANEFDSELGKLVGHLYQIETRQNTYGDKDTVSVMRFGRQSETYKYNDSNIYSAGAMLEWSGKTAQINSETSRVSTYLFYYGQQEKDVISNGAHVEYTQGEVYRKQLYINIVEPLGAPLIDNIAEGKGYNFEWYRNTAEQQYTQSFGRLTSENLVGNSNFLYKSAAREHFHAFNDFDATKIANPTGLIYDFIIFGEDSIENNIFLRKFSKITDNIEKFFHKENFTETKYYFEVAKIDSPKWSAMKHLDAQKYLNFVHIGENLTLEYEFKANLYKNYVKLDETHTKTEEFTNSAHDMTIILGNSTFFMSFTEDNLTISFSKEGQEQNSPSIKMSTETIEINPGTPANMLTDNIIIGGGAGPQYLVTKSFLDLVFKNHIHPTAGPGAPTLPPIDIPIPQIADSPANTYTMQIKGE